METLGVPTINRITMEDFILESGSHYFTRIKTKEDLLSESEALGLFGTKAIKFFRDNTKLASINTKLDSTPIDCFKDKISFVLPSKNPEAPKSVTVLYWIKTNTKLDISISGFKTSTIDNILKFNTPEGSSRGIEIASGSLVFIAYTTNHVSKDKYYQAISINGKRVSGTLSKRSKGLCRDSLNIELSNFESTTWKLQDITVLWDKVLKPAQIHKIYERFG
jgi:hypothetical protein